MDLLFNKKGSTSNKKSLIEDLGGSIDKIEINDANVAKATVVIQNLVFISYYVADIEKKLKDLYPDDNSFAMLSFKQSWVLKYSHLAKNCLHIIPNDVLNENQRQHLFEGLGV